MDEPWSWHGLSKNPKLTFDFVFNNLDKPWSWFIITKNLDNIRNNIITREKQKTNVLCVHNVKGNLLFNLPTYVIGEVMKFI
jgi:hypothetical protein